MEPSSESAPDRSDASLVAALRAGDEGALADLYRRYAEGLLAVAYRITGSRDDAEDVVHDVFVGLERALRSYDERGRLLAWLRRVTARTALMQARSRRRREARHDAVAEREEAPPDPVEDRLAVRDALEEMSAKLRVVFVLKEIEGFSHGEIAEMLGISEGASSMRLSRAWTFLCRTLGEEAS